MYGAVIYHLTLFMLTHYHVKHMLQIVTLRGDYLCQIAYR